MNNIQSGKLNQRVFLQKNTGTQHAQTGAIVDNWQNVAGLWANVQPMTGRERAEAQRVTPEITHQVLIRYRDDIAPQRRLLIPKNNTTLGASIANNSVTSITIADSDLIQTDMPQVIRIEDEFLIVTAGYSTTTLTVTRGAFGSTAAAHSNSTVVQRMGILEIDSVISVDNQRVKLMLTCKEREHG